MAVVLSSVVVSRVKSYPLVQMLLDQMMAFVFASLFSSMLPSGQLMSAAGILLPPNFKVLSGGVLLHKSVLLPLSEVITKSSDLLLQTRSRC